MHSYTVLLTLLASASLIAALPQATPTPSAADVYTGADVNDAWPGGDDVNATATLRRRGGYGECEECSPTPTPCQECDPTPPPEPPCDECEKKKRYKGSIYVKCEDCDDEECCKCIGLDTYKPHFLYYGDDPIPKTHNLQITPWPYGYKKHFFWYDPTDYYFYAWTNPDTAIGYSSGDEGEWTLASDAYANPFIIKNGLIASGKKYPGDSDDFYVCKEPDSALRLFYGCNRPPKCCPVKVYFTKKYLKGYEDCGDDDYKGGEHY